MATIARKKAWRPKSKTGCLTCRIRRVKCGEERPRCLRCTKTGRKCDGYDSDHPEMSSAPPSRRDSKISSSNKSPTDSSITSYTPDIVEMPSPVIEWDEEERRSFNFFIAKTAPELSGSFESKFWTSLILQRCHSDPPIRHAVIALGALNESFKFGDIKLLGAGAIADPKQRFALLQNIKAIRYLTGHPSNGFLRQSSEVILISCLLFICFEAMQGNYQAAFAHLNSGLKILGDWMETNERNSLTYSESSVNQEFIRSEIVPLFGALNTQAIRILPASFFQREMTNGSTKLGFAAQTCIPDPISSLNEAKHHLQNQTHAILVYHQNAAQYCSSGVPNSDRTLRSSGMNAMVDERRDRILQLEQWSRVFNNFAQAVGQTMNTSDLRASISLKLHHVANKLILETAQFESELNYDRYMDQFELMTSLAESLLKSYGDSRLENGRVFSFDTAIIPPLLCVACKCRDPSLRRRAHALLVSSFKREGGWDSDLGSSIGRWTIDKEEKNLENISRAEEVVESSRIVITEITSLGPRKALIKFRQGPRRDDRDEELQEEWILW
ncbi:uncharacterized protein EAE97_009780 [Botrytis byssoidea]|uniref:Zn(2)-C6 fungal-type domain-containing protein n=1 Tax=Botrytis byssoidea TaxID=139641 RepID=A0A9P5I494_9HELO|nr:uncharacterized protein EAE97_009780 [Botrytis byssoidea]KAF7928938.1 hypothetical protein EAE97_009780 [Botrytis byssoidea]